MFIATLTRKIYTFTNYVRYSLLRNSTVSVGEKVSLIGPIIFSLTKGSKVILNNGTKLSCSIDSYHLGVFMPMKLVTSRETAIISIGSNTRIHSSCLHARDCITIGNNCLIAANCQIFDSSGHDTAFDNVESRIHTHGVVKKITIEDNVWIGTGSIILPGAKIGYGSIISAGSVVTGEIPPMSIVGGNPAKVIKQYISQSSENT